MAHPLPSYPPYDLRLQGRWARQLTITVAPSHGKPCSLSSAPSRPCGRATREDPRSCHRCGSWTVATLCRFPPASGCRPPWSPEGRFASLRNGPSAHPSPDLLQPALQRLWRAAGGSGASTRSSTSRRLVGWTPTRRGRRLPSTRGRPSAQMSSPVPPQACPKGATSGRPGGATRSSRPGRAR